MAKDAYYFSHDSNARNDQKMLAVRLKYGMRGYGIYFGIIEMLREANAKQMSSKYNLLAFELHEDEETIKDIIENFDLFVCENGYFWSESLRQRIEKYSQLIESRRLAGKKGGQASAQAKLKQNSSKPQALKERKGKESKVNKNTVLAEPKTPQAKFLESFSGLYERMTGYQFKTDKKHYAMIAKLLNQYGYDEAVEKTKLLAIYCQQGEVWFCKDGWADFTPEKLINRWNNIVPIKTQDQKKAEKSQAVKDEVAEHERKVRELLKNPA